MKTSMDCGARVVIVLLLVLGLAVLVGCGQKEEAEPTESMKTTESAQTVAGEQQMQDTTQVGQAGDWTATYANPQVGVCPVCKMGLIQDYVTVATIGDKKYACCSARCATMLSENPDQYLKEDMPAEESHEGHSH